MTHLRTMMTEELVRRNYSESTRECYIRTIQEFSLYFNCSPDKLGLEHIRIFQAHLFSDRKLSPNTVNQRLAALRFFFVKTLLRPWNTAQTPYPKRVISLPKILSPEEVGLLIESAILPFHRVMLMTLYATGVRRAELANMRVSDIDSKRMAIRIRGKGLKDREVMLSKVLIEALREHWKQHRSAILLRLCLGWFLIIVLIFVLIFVLITVAVLIISLFASAVAWKRLTIFVVIDAGSTRSLGNSVKDACKAIAEDRE